MMFDVHVVSPLDFPTWVESTAKSGTALNADSYKQLAQQSIETGRPTYRLPDPRLFNDIATQRIPPGPGPQIADNPAKPKPESGAAIVR
jgi:cytochrome o ubiquinol oxidase subunit 2